MLIYDANPIKYVHGERDRGMEIYCKLEGLDSDYIETKITLENDTFSIKSKINYLKETADKSRNAFKKLAGFFALKKGSHLYDDYVSSRQKS